MARMSPVGSAHRASEGPVWAPSSCLRSPLIQELRHPRSSSWEITVFSGLVFRDGGFRPPWEICPSPMQLNPSPLCMWLACTAPEAWLSLWWREPGALSQCHTGPIVLTVEAVVPTRCQGPA